MSWSHELRPGEVKSVQYFGRQLALWRGTGGEAYLQDAFCLHLGTNGAIGGEVKRDDLMCPWHGWEWDGQERNACNPYSVERRKDQLRIRTYPFQEWCGMVMAWYADDPEQAPTWDLPEVPECGHDDYFDLHPTSNRIFRAKVHPQMPVENSVDPAHVAYIHGTRVTPGGPVKSLVEMNCYGVGTSVIRWQEPLPTVQFAGFTVVDNEYNDYYFAQCSARPAGSDRTEPTGFAKTFLEAQWRVLPQDCRWASQFYRDEDRNRVLDYAENLG